MTFFHIWVVLYLGIYCIWLYRMWNCGNFIGIFLTLWNSFHCIFTQIYLQWKSDLSHCHFSYLKYLTLVFVLSGSCHRSSEASETDFPKSSSNFCIIVWIVQYFHSDTAKLYLTRSPGVVAVWECIWILYLYLAWKAKKKDISYYLSETGKC